MQGPVLILQLFGLCDVSVELIVIGVRNDCLKWSFLGALGLCMPLACLFFGIYKCHSIYEASDFEFKRFEHRDVKTIYNEAMQAHGWKKKVMTLLVDLHDKRFVGDWGKKSSEAKRFGFLLANTSGYWVCFTQPLVRKFVTAILVNIPDPGWNAVLMIVFYWIDLFLLAYLQGHRDHLVNFSGAFVAIGNLASLIMTCIKVLLPPMQRPQWLQGPAVLVLTATMTAVCALAALIDPLAICISCASRLLRSILKSGGCIVMLQPILTLLFALRVSLVSRVRRIFFSRAKQGMKQELMKDKAKEIEDKALTLRSFRLWLQNTKDMATCSACGREAQKDADALEQGFQPCSVCKLVVYCSAECMELHRDFHIGMCLSTAACTLKLFSSHVSDLDQEKPSLDNDGQDSQRHGVSGDITVALTIDSNHSTSRISSAWDTTVEKINEDAGQILRRKDEPGHHHDQLDDGSSSNSSHSVHSADSNSNTGYANSAGASVANVLAPGFFARRARDNGSGSTKFGSFKSPGSAKLDQPSGEVSRQEINIESTFVLKELYRSHV